MKNFLKQVTATLIGLIIFSIFAISILSNRLMLNLRKKVLPATAEQNLKSNSILHIKLQGELKEHKTNFLSSEFSLFEFGYGLKKAAKDPNIKGVLIQITPFFNPKRIPYLEEMVNSIKEFQKSNKPVAIYSGDYNLTLLSMFSSADSIVVNPMGNLSIQGPSTTILHYKVLLDRLGITPVVLHAGKNKNAGENLVEEVPMEETKKRTLALLSSFYKYFIQNMSQNRGIPLEKIKNINEEHAFLNPDQAKTLNIIDQIGNKSQAIEALDQLIEKQKNNPKLPFKESKDTHATSKPKDKRNAIDLLSYNKICQTKDVKKAKKEDQIIIIPLEGTIMRGGHKEKTIGAESTIAIIEKYANDENYKAIVLTIESGGGSVIASEEIRNVIDMASQKKPVVALIRSVGASGGYYIIMNADWIMAQELSIIGSIGVIAMGFEISELLQNLGIHVENIKTSPYGNIDNIYYAKSEKEKAFLQNVANYLNQVFRSSLIKYRKLNPEKVATFADGRVFLAKKAKEHGLIDEIGNLERAIEKAAELAELKPNEYSVGYHKNPVKIRDFLLHLTA